MSKNFLQILTFALCASNAYMNSSLAEEIDSKKIENACKSCCLEKPAAEQNKCSTDCAIFTTSYLRRDIKSAPCSVTASYPPSPAAKNCWKKFWKCPIHEERNPIPRDQIDPTKIENGCKSCCLEKPVAEQNKCINDCTLFTNDYRQLHSGAEPCSVTASYPPSPAAKNCWKKFWKCPIHEGQR